MGRTRHRKVLETIGAGAVAAALVATPLAVIGATAGAAEAQVLLSADFDDESLGDLQQSGNPILGYVAEGDGYALSVTDRANSWDSVSSADGTFEAGKSYAFSARVKLPEGAAATEARLTAFNGASGDAADYKWVGNTAVTADAWTTIEGTYALPEGSVPASSKVTVEVGGGAPWPAFLLDDVVVTVLDSGDAGDIVLSSDFESGVEPWFGRGTAEVERTAADAHSGEASMLVTGRTANWHGAATSIGSLFAVGQTYDLSAWVKLAPGEAATSVKATVAEVPEDWTEVAPAVSVTDQDWVQLTGTYTRGEGVTGGDLYFEAAGGTTSFLVDDVVITGQAVTDDWVPDLEGFVPGGAVNPTSTPVGAARGTGNVAALTFDDGPNGADTEELLDFLAENDLPATFCVIGEQITAPGGAELLRRIVADGYTLCNHSTGWADMGGYTKAEVEADLKANLAIIREALGDPEAKVPFFRAPNGSWGQTIPVAVALGMQPLAVSNTINDWATQDEAVLTENLRAAIQPGRIVLVHDGGGDRAASVAATKTVVSERLAAGWTFTLPQGGAEGPGDPDTGTGLNNDFEESLGAWGPRGTATTVAERTDASAAADTAWSAVVTERTSAWNGLAAPTAGELTDGATYDVSAWVRLGSGSANVHLSVARSESFADADRYQRLLTAEGVGSEWTQLRGRITVPTETESIYFETGAGTGDLYVDEIEVALADITIQPLDPLYGTFDIPVGVAIDARETTGAASQLLLRHFNQVTPENHMKPYAFYDAERNLRLHPEAIQTLDFAQENGLGYYGHVLVWHSQNPGQSTGDGWESWLFHDDAGNPLPTDGSARDLMLERMRDHIFGVAELLAAEYGPFGSDTNPIVAWDVINEVVADTSNYEDGLRRSAWYQTVGADYIDWSFRYAEEAFNQEFAAPGTNRPVTLFINDYNTEQSGKQQRYHDLVERLLADDVPIDGVGHQFHVNLAMPVSNLEGAIERFADLDVIQAVTELDVTAGNNPTEAALIEQGYYYRDAFRVFREHQDELFSVTVWGLTDPRSWRSAQLPLLFDGQLQAKPAFFGAAEGGLPERIRTANVFGGDVALDGDATSALEWQQLRLHAIEGAGAFQLRWNADHLTAYVDVTDATATGIELQVGDQTYAFGRDGSGDVPGEVAEVAGGWQAVVHVPLTDAAEGSTLRFDARVVGATTSGWNTGGALGTLTLVEPLSYLEVAQAAAAPVVDGLVDDVWQDAAGVVTGKQVSGTNTAAAEVRTLWRDSTLWVLAEVTDPDVDVTGSDPWTQDSVEIYVDAGNFKNGPYRYDDTQIRISAENAVSFGTGDEAFQQNRVQSATTVTDTGYVVEAAISLLEDGGLGTFHGLDFQVNDATDGARIGITNWADPTSAGYQSTARWGVGQLVEAVSTEPTPTPTPTPTGEPTATPTGQPTPTPTTDPKPNPRPSAQISLGATQVRAGEAVQVRLSGFEPGDSVTIALGAGVTATGSRGAAVGAAAAPSGTTQLATVRVGDGGTAVVSATIPAATTPGTYLLVAAVDGTVVADAAVQVLAAAPGASGGSGSGLAVTGAGLGLAGLALLVILAGVALVVARHRGMTFEGVRQTLLRR